MAPRVATEGTRGDVYAPRAYVALKPSYVKGSIFYPTRGVFRPGKIRHVAEIKALTILIYPPSIYAVVFLHF